MLIGRRKTDAHNCQRWEISTKCYANLIFSTRLEFAPSRGANVTLEELSVREAMFQLSTDVYVELISIFFSKDTSLESVSAGSCHACM